MKCRYIGIRKLIWHCIKHITASGAAIIVFGLPFFSITALYAVILSRQYLTKSWTKTPAYVRASDCRIAPAAGLFPECALVP
jgi:hypothetical protein